VRLRELVLPALVIAASCSNAPQGAIDDGLGSGGTTSSGGTGGTTGGTGGVAAASGASVTGGTGGTGGQTTGGTGGTGGAGAVAGVGGSVVGGTGGTGGSAGTAAGAGGSAGSAASAGTAGTGPMPIPGPPYAFPQGYRSTRCTYPTGADPAQAKKAYDRWKLELVTSEGAGENLRVRRPNNEMDTTVSEGIAYGMIFSVVFGDQDQFDKLWKYARSHANQKGFMMWRIQSDGSVTPGIGDEGAATDADEDMAWALILADKKWGGSGSIGQPYLDAAKEQIERIWTHEVDHGRGELLIAGDSWGPTVAHNPSYFAPNQYRRFAQVTGNMGWLTVIEKNYAVLASTLTAMRGNESNGLVPAWTDPEGNPAMPWDGAPMHYQYDSARIPFRLAQDWCDFGDPRAKTYLDKTSSFFSGIGAASIVDGYDLNGMPRAENPLPAQSALFVGGAGVGAMSDVSRLAFVDATYQLMLTKELYPPSYYYNLCWQVFSLLMMTGNLYDYTLVP
jgi:endo-1,4-beta-D-glucanase Y